MYLAQKIQAAINKPKSKAVQALQQQIKADIGATRRIHIPPSGRNRRPLVQDVANVLMGGKLVTSGGDVYYYRKVEGKPYQYEAIAPPREEDNG